MNKNENLNRAKVEKNDEFYTMLTDIEKELKHYTHHFKDKVVYMNCDEPSISNFCRFFHLSFKSLEIKKLIATHYSDDGDVFKYEYSGENDEDLTQWTKTPLKGDGDFRSDECVRILKESDIVVTNPPFSLFRDYIELMMKYNKKFLIIGNINAVKYKKIFPLIKENKIWLGYNTPKEFLQPNGKIKKFGNINWYTNLNIVKIHEKLILYRKYNESLYPKYDYYNAINVDKVNEIPIDYNGKIGVPITFLNKYNPEQFEIIDVLNKYANLDSENSNDYIRENKLNICSINGVAKYSRIIIKKIKH